MLIAPPIYGRIAAYLAAYLAGIQAADCRPDADFAGTRAIPARHRTKYLLLWRAFSSAFQAPSEAFKQAFSKL